MTRRPAAGDRFVIPAVAGWGLLWIAFNAGRPPHLDDPLFLTWARALLPAPGEPRADTINWSGTLEALDAQIAHYPPLWAWVLAAARRFGSTAPSFLHFLQWPFFVMAVAGVMRLARGWGAPVRTAAVVAASSPLLLLPAITLMPDLPCLGAGLLGLGLWLGATGRRDLVIGAALIVLGAQMKQTILPLLPLLFFLPGPGGVSVRFRLGLALAVCVLAGWYPPGAAVGDGNSIVGHSAWIARWAWEPGLLLPRLLYGVAVVGAVVVAPPVWVGLVAVDGAGAADRATRIWKAAVAGAVAILVGGWGARELATGAVAAVPSDPGAVWIAAGVVAMVAWALRGAVAVPGSMAAFGGLAVAGSLIGTPFPAVRFLVFLLPVVAALVAADLHRRLTGGALRAGVVAVTAANLWLAVSLAAHDGRLAGFSARIARAVAPLARDHGVPLTTTGHWALQHAVEAEGGRVVDRVRDSFPGGAVCLIPRETDHRQLPEALRARAVSHGAVSIPAAWWEVVLPFRPLAAARSAGWYGGQVWLPYAWGGGPEETIETVVIAPVRGAARRR